jgi:hypothetical protein
MTTRYTIGNTPVAITSAGQSGSCWLDEKGDTQSTEIFIYHSGKTVADGKRVYTSKSNTDLLTLSADSGTDFFYAVKTGSGVDGTLIVDVI